MTDGQLPLRQCLHPEACTKDIKLPTYYWRFCDLRKEYSRYRSGDISQALIAINDAKKLQTLPPTTPLPNSISEMVTGAYCTSSKTLRFGYYWLLTANPFRLISGKTCLRFPIKVVSHNVCRHLVAGRCLSY